MKWWLVGANVIDHSKGDRVAALLTGGGYAQYAVADERVTIGIPDGLIMVEAAALPGTFMTVWLNLFQRGQFKAGESVLIAEALQVSERPQPCSPVSWVHLRSSQPSHRRRIKRLACAWERMSNVVYMSRGPKPHQRG
ncbi:hypothetical protein [Xanthomonas sp. SHU 308]|uniref:hypothetical protein n=1 Tax=Xanthomonas sp. SHU 308 TaxID=1591201 RepID=UPI0012FF5899|nr:hypothetical protein [Xanthomonas sp. SHU 308]